MIFVYNLYRYGLGKWGINSQVINRIRKSLTEFMFTFMCLIHKRSNNFTELFQIFQLSSQAHSDGSLFVKISKSVFIQKGIVKIR